LDLGFLEKVLDIIRLLHSEHVLVPVVKFAASDNLINY